MSIQILIFLVLRCTASDLFVSDRVDVHDPVVARFMEIDLAPRHIVFSNNLAVNRHGGHLQGVQSIKKEGVRYLLLSGSSDTFSYYAVVRLGDENRVSHIVKLLDKPYKHAGGFQVCENLMAIGVEDNDARDRSKVMIFDISNPEQPPDKPLSVIDRQGPRHRSTAGCVALARQSTGWIMVVGDWDTKHLDFYTTEKSSMPGHTNPFILVHTIDTEKTDKTGWSDPSWLSYQNINLIISEKGNLFLLGLTSNGSNEDVADLFEMDAANNNEYHLQKIATKNLGKNMKTKFRWGAGVEQMPGDTLRILSCSDHIETQSSVHEYY